MERLDQHFRTLTRAAFQRYGFAYADLLQHWPAIVGDDLAAMSAPERLRWPRRAENAEQSRPSGATLTVRAQEGRAIELQHEAATILERINRFFGYGAVATLKIRQAPLSGRDESPASVPELPEDAERSLASNLEGIGDARLKAALRRLGQAALASRGRRSLRREQ
jgi:hypothetical protein